MVYFIIAFRETDFQYKYTKTWEKTVNLIHIP